MDFQELRATTDATRAMTYMNAGWAGPSPKRVVDRMAEAAKRESADGPAGPGGQAFAHEIEAEARANAAKMLHVSPDDLLLTHGTTEGVNIVIGGLAWEPGDTLVTCNLEHPGIRTPATLAGQRRGVSVTTVELAPNASEEECIASVRAALNGSVKLVALSHITFTTGLRIPAKAIVDAAHEVGALVLYDGAQTAGHIAMDLTEMSVDFYASSGQKWLMGPTGSGAFYAKKEHRDRLTPQFSAPGLDFREGFGLYALASQGVVARAGYAEAVAIHNEIGSEVVESHNFTLATQLRQGLAKIPGVSINGPTSGPTASAITAISAEGWEPPAFAEALWERHRVVTRHVPNPPGARICTAAFNDASDVDSTLAAIADVLR